MTLQSLSALVYQMREAQKQYFKFRSKALLNKCIQLERKVDEAVKDIELPKDNQTKIPY